MEARSRILARLRALAVTLALLSGSAMAQEAGRLHHVHLNVTDAEKSTAFYQRHFGVIPIRWQDRVPALLLERSFLLMETRPAGSIVNHQRTGFTHISWSTRSGPATYEWLKGQGVEFYTPLEDLVPGSTYMYAYGPDREVIEIVDIPGHHRMNHIHIVAEDAKATAEWFRALIAHPQPVTAGPMRNENLTIDDISFTVFPIGARFTPRENDGTLLPTDGSHLDHLAFSFRDLDAALARIRAQGVAIERPIERDPTYGFRRFFVRAPNKVLVELVEATPWPEAAWERVAR